MRILFLSTWFPYPLSQGSKIRAYYLIRALARQHEVALISFADTEIEPDWVKHMQHFCSQVDVVQQHPFQQSRIKSIRGWFSLLPSAVSTYYSPEMEKRVQALAATWKPDCVVALTFVTAPYAAGVEGAVKIVDVDNLMSPMLYELSRNAENRLDRYRRLLAWWKFQRYEKQLYSRFHGCLVVSERDAVRMDELLSISQDRICVVQNGVDTARNIFGLADPQPATLVFNGSLTYDFNLDAIRYFLTEIFPLILAQEPAVQLRVTGNITDSIVDQLPSYPQVSFTGYLEDIRPAVAGSWVCTVPLRLGGGSRLKILEAMALGVPVVSTSKGAEGLAVERGRHLLIADSPNEFAKQTLILLRNQELRTALIHQAGQLVREQYDWEKIGLRFCQFMEEQLAKNNGTYPGKAVTLTIEVG